MNTQPLFPATKDIEAGNIISIPDNLKTVEEIREFILNSNFD